MSEGLDARVKALEDEVERLREILESLSVRDVDGNLTIDLSGASDVAISVGNVGNNVSVENSGEMEDVSVNTAHVGNNVEVICEDGDINGVSVSTGSVGNSVISGAED